MLLSQGVPPLVVVKQWSCGKKQAISVLNVSISRTRQHCAETRYTSVGMQVNIADYYKYLQFQQGI